MASYSAGLPDAYADLWLPRNSSRMVGALGNAVGRFGVAEVAFPGAPKSALVAFCSAATEWENTGALIRGQVANVFFCETGYFGNESGPTFVGPLALSCRQRRTPFAQCTFGPVPNPDPQAPYANYARFATNPFIRRPDMLGRNASLAPNACFDVPQSTAVAMLNLRWHGDQVAQRLPADVRPSRPDTLWAVTLCLGGWSAGDARMAAGLRPYANDLAGVPEQARPGLWSWLIARDVLAHRLPAAPPRNYALASYLNARCNQKLRAGAAVERVVNRGARSSWYVSSLAGAQERAVFDVIARSAYGAALRAVDIGPPPVRVAPAGELWMPSGIVMAPPPVAFYHPEEMDRADIRYMQPGHDGTAIGIDLMATYGGAAARPMGAVRTK